MSAPVPLTDYRRVYDAVPSARLMPWAMRDGATKRPLTPHGIKDATRDPDTLAGWAKRWPDALVGIVHISAGVVDVDLIDGGLPGIARARELAPSAPEGTSLSGGAHLWVSCTGRAELHCNRPAGKMGTPGLEWRGPEAGFIAITKSDLEALSGELPAVSNELVALVTGEAKPEPVPAPTEQHLDRGVVTLTRRGIDAVRTATEGGREPAVNNLAFLCGRLRGAGRLPDEHLAKIMEQAEDACRENGALAKYGDGWLDGKFRHGLADGAREPLPSQATERAQAEPRGPSKRDETNSQWQAEQRPVLHGVPLRQPVTALEAMSVELRRNLRSMDMEHRPAGSADIWAWEPVTDEYMAMWRTDTSERWIHPRKGDTPPKAAHIGREVWDDGCTAHCARSDHRTEPVLEWMESCANEPGAPTVEDLIESVWSVPDEYAGAWAQAVSRVLLIGAAYMAVHPGGKMDIMPVLIGDEGLGKSSLFRLLLPPQRQDAGWFVDGISTTTPHDKAWEKVRSSVFAEMTEMRGRDRADVDDLKTLITQQDTTVRLPYGRHPVTIRARHVWVGTANHVDVIPQRDGRGRRFAPVLLDGARMDRDGMDAWMNRWRESLWAQALARVRAGERPLFTAEEEAVQAGHVQQHMSGSSDLVDDMVAGVAAAIDADHAAGAHGISLRKTLMQVGGGDEQTVRKNEMRVTALLRDEGYVSRKNRWDESKTKTTRWFCGPVVLGGPRWSVVSHCTDESSVVVNNPPKGAINNNSSVEGYNGKPRTTTDHGPQPETEDLAGFDELMAEMICPQCGREAIPQPSGICGQCEALAR